MPRRRSLRSPDTAGATPLARLHVLSILGVLAIVAGVLLYGLGFTLVSSFATHPAGSTALTSAGTQANSGQRRDLIAAAPMTIVADNAATTPEVAISLPPEMALPTSSTVGASGVPTGFPDTPEGAAAQLAAIEVRVLSAMSLPVATEVYRDWALPGGVGATGWSQTRNVQAFLTHAGQSSNVLDPGTLVSVTLAAVQIKGTDGPAWLVACVLLDVRAALKNEARMGYGTCERMHWTTDRWQIGPGTPPAPAPSTWPGSDASVQAGWKPVTPS